MHPLALAAVEEVMSKHKVVVVDDDEALCDTITTILRRRGFDAEGYGEAERFLTEAFDVRHPHTEQPDLVMIDLLLGNDKMQGMDLIKELVARDISSEILVVSGNRSSADLLRAAMLGASDWVSKPFNYITLMPRLTTMAETGRKRRLHRDVDSREMDVTRLARPVFLSYSENDKVLASVIRRYLEARGIGVWYAPATIRVGDPWQDRISEGINDAKIFVALFTDSYFTRPYCIDELIEFDQRTRTSLKPKPLLFALTFGFSEATRQNPTFQDIRNRHQCKDISEHRFLDGLTDLLLQIEDCLA
jgi:FixJ family two-component response regulator